MKIIIKQFLYTIWLCIWNFIPTTIGAFSWLICRFIGYETKFYKGAIVTIVKNKKFNAGLNLGLFIFISEGAENLLPHEWGHSIQGCILGPLWIFLVGIPSTVRFWYREFIRKYNYDKYKILPPYDSIWFEKTATLIGNKYSNINSNKNF